MPAREATARIKINRLLEAAGWRFFAEGALAANIRLEPGVTLRPADLDALGETSNAPVAALSISCCSTPAAFR